MKAVARALDDRDAPPRPAIPAKTGAAHPSKTPPLALIWGISLALLFASGILLFVSLGVSKFTASNLQNQVQALTTMVLRLAIGPAIFAWSVKRKGYRFLTFSVAYAVVAAAVAFYFHAKSASNKQFGSAVRAFANDTQHYVEEGRTGKVPTAKSTGDPVNDELLRLMNDFTQAVAPVFANIDRELAALEMKDVFDVSVLANQGSLDTEARKRTQSQQIIQKGRTDLSQAIDTFLQNVTIRNVSTEQQRQMRQGLEEGIKSQSLSVATMFNLRDKQEKAELDFLYFMASIFGEYELKDGKLFFRNAASRQKYNELAKSVTNTTKELEAFRKAMLETQARKLQQLNQ